MSVEKLRNEVSCFLCQGFFKDPVSIHCGHNFCQACIARFWEGRTDDFSCPSCKETVPQRSLRPSYELANITEVAKGWTLQLAKEVKKKEKGENWCEEHQEALKLFCEDEKKLICVVCDRSKVHREHSVVPVNEAAQEYKEQICTQLQHLKTEQHALLSSRDERIYRIQYHAKKMEIEKQKIVTKYKQLKEFLEEQKSFQLDYLEQLDTEIMKAHNGILNKISEKITSLEMLMDKMEKTCRKPDCELLKDIKAIFSRCEKENFSEPLDIPPELKEKFSDFTEKTTIVMKEIEKFQGILDFNLFLSTKMTLDPKTASAELQLSEDCRSMSWENPKKDPPSDPERFEFHPCVLGSRGFSSGRHCWEVEVSKEGLWAIGVAKESVPRKSRFPLKPEAGVWALCHNKDGYKALTSSHSSQLLSCGNPRQIRVCLDCKKGRVMFFDAVNKVRLFAFRWASFGGERIYPWFLAMKDAGLQLDSQGNGKKTQTPNQVTTNKQARG
ncbi:zinc finger protein RFP-like [Cuculus canorus]|uniref:zinc finger protein RFP-like n=1 Tax=Cuculus canorus TaxID=55661 RepID=UPI0023AADFBC|nr:zinc finger protein RFP-like [Cuculus canorus]